jgi:hydroxymethylpyrimidine pyrophosphatase-like HAD family hydrolase
VTSPVLIAADLDRTLIYSRAANELTFDSTTPLTCVELYNGRAMSFMTDKAVELISYLQARALVVPVSTRTHAQLMRVEIPTPIGPYAVAANGGVLLVDGRVDQRWTEHVRLRLTACAALDEVWAHASEVFLPSWTSRLRNAEDLFCYAVVDRAAMPAAFVAEIAEWCAARGWTTSLQGGKLYLVPDLLTKSAAVLEIARRVEAAVVLAAGDSLLDIDLLAAADFGIHPGHGEIADLGWTAPHVSRTQSSGVQAGEEICQWFVDTIGGASSSTTQRS